MIEFFCIAVERFKREASPPLDRDAERLLVRLVSDDWRDHVLPALRIYPRDQWPVLIRDCISAEREARRHRSIVEHARATADGSARARQDLKNLEKFITAARRMIVVEGHDPVPEAFRTLRGELDSIRWGADRERRQRSQKTEEAAGIAAGIGWLSESVKQVTGKAHHRAVADLAEAVFCLDRELDEDMVRRALTPSERARR